MATLRRPTPEEADPKEEVHWRIRKQSNGRTEEFSFKIQEQKLGRCWKCQGIDIADTMQHQTWVMSILQFAGPYYRIVRESNWCGKSTSTFFQLFHSCFSANLWPVCHLHSATEALKTCQRLTPLKGWSEAFVARGLFFKLFSTNTSAVTAQTTSLTSLDQLPFVVQLSCQPQTDNAIPGAFW